MTNLVKTRFVFLYKSSN